MNADMNTLMTLMSMLGGGEKGGNRMQTLLPLLMSMMTARGGNGSAQSTADTGTAQSAAGAGERNPFGMLPFLMNMMKCSSEPFRPGADAAKAAGAEEKRGAEEGNARASGAEYPRGGGGRGESTSYGYAGRRYGETPFGDIGFAGSEVRSFMETLWRVRKRV